SAADALARIGPLAKAAAPALIDALNDDDPEVRDKADFALFEMGSVAVPFLLHGLTRDEPRIRSAVAETLGSILPRPRTAVPALIKALKDKDAVVRLKTVQALGAIADSTAIPSLLSIHQDDADMHVRDAVLVALLNYEDLPKDAIPGLIGILKRESLRTDRSDSLFGHNAARVIALAGSEVVLPLAELLRDQYSNKRLQVMIIQ